MGNETVSTTETGKNEFIQEGAVNLRPRLGGRIVIVVLLLLTAVVIRWDYMRTDDAWLDYSPLGPEITLFFADDTASYLLPEKRHLTEGSDVTKESLAIGIIEALIAGPSSESGLLVTVPPEAVVHDVTIEGDLLQANFGEELRRFHWGGSTGEILTVYSIVHSLAELPGVERVWILLEGAVAETLSGHLDISRPIGPDPGMLPPDVAIDG